MTGAALVSIAVASLSSGAGAEIDVRALARAWHAPASGGPASDGGLSSLRDYAAIVEAPNPGDLDSEGLTRIGSKWSVVRAPLADLNALALAHPSWQITWSPPLRPLLDHAATWVEAPAFRNDTGLTGSGVYVGIVDTGADVTHPDLRNADGSTRIQYFVDFASKPTGNYPAAEQRCNCAVYPKANLDALLANRNRGSALSDADGHGTHVASLAAGNGGAEKKYVGIAPEASLVVVRAFDANGSADDPTVLAGVDMVFWLAEQDAAKANLANQPAVVNLSLGSDFGPHDGSTALERSLADLVGPAFPGRAIVVAAGNSAATSTGQSLSMKCGASTYSLPAAYADPLGIHTEVNVPAGSSVRVPIVAAPSCASLTGAIDIWIDYRPGDDLQVGLDRLEGTWIEPVPRGGSDTSPVGDPSATIVNGTRRILNELVSDDVPDAGQLPDDTAAAVLIGGPNADTPFGDWSSSEVFSIRLEGHGTATLWLETEGNLDPQVGALFPRASAQATIGIPAANAALIAVGATMNRNDWVDIAREAIDVDFLGSPDSIGVFSSAGPTTDLRIKPDLVAPGGFVVGALSRDAQPSINVQSIFANGGGFCCDPNVDPGCPQSNCDIVDATHAVAIGTSMSAPIVTGAVALLFEKDPTLTQDRILSLLQAGVRRPGGFIPLDSQLGAGALDLERVRDVQDVSVDPVRREPSAEQSWMVLGQSYAHPDPAWQVPAIVELRDANGKIATGFGGADGRSADSGASNSSDAGAFRLEVDNGTVTGALQRVEPGFFRFSVAANAGTGEASLGVRLLYKGEPFLSKSIPIAVDVNVVREGFAAQGGCRISERSPRRAAETGTAALAVAVIALRRRRRTRGARTARNPDRMGSSDRDRRGSSRR